MGFGNIFAGGGVQLKKVQTVVKTVQRVAVVPSLHPAEAKYVGTTTIGTTKTPSQPATNLNQSGKNPAQQQAKVMPHFFFF
jgi:hypothetical protein